MGFGGKGAAGLGEDDGDSDDGGRGSDRLVLCDHAIDEGQLQSLAPLD